MKKVCRLVILFQIFLLTFPATNLNEIVTGRSILIKQADQKCPLGKPGLQLTYHHIRHDKLPTSVVRKLVLKIGSMEQKNDIVFQWLQLYATKENKATFTVWLLCSDYPAKKSKNAQKDVKRYIFQEGYAEAVEFRHKKLGIAVLPSTGAWEYLLPRSDKQHNPIKSLATKIQYLGHEYQLTNQEQSNIPNIPVDPHSILLSPDLLTGVPHNTRQKDETRRYDESDYELIRLLKSDYQEMIAAGLNCFRVDAEQVEWIEQENVYYWGIGGDDVSYPECLYKSNYIGPALFFDEPMVRTRDYVVKPKLQNDPRLRKELTPQKVFEDFKKLYHETKYEHSPTALLKGLAKRDDVNVGDMHFLQQNMYTWETMVSSALYQLSEGERGPPYAMVFEPPGRFGTRRVLPELNMCFDCQIPVDSPKNLATIIFSFLRGAGRVTGKEWGTSIYGAVDRADTFWLLTHAYDLGASLFFYWDSYQLACVPYNEYLAMTKHLQAHAQNFPKRDMEKLKSAAEVAILLPPGYNLGHVYMGRGVFWGIPELNLDRNNQYGISYRRVMRNFYTEVERCLRLGVAFDSFWDLDNLKLSGYREIVTIREDGKVVVSKNGVEQVLESARTPARPEGIPPQLSVEILQIDKEDARNITARAKVTPGSAPIFYTQGADKNGIYNNQYVLWELFGPKEEDYYYLWKETWQAKVIEEPSLAEIEIKFSLKIPGNYRLRAATCDAAGRSTVVWKEINLEE